MLVPARGEEAVHEHSGKIDLGHSYIGPVSVICFCLLLASHEHSGRVRIRSGPGAHALCAAMRAGEIR